MNGTKPEIFIEIMTQNKDILTSSILLRDLELIRGESSDFTQENTFFMAKDLVLFLSHGEVTSKIAGITNLIQFQGKENTP